MLNTETRYSAKGERVENITPELTQLIDDMLETMHDAHGIGLAAQQIGRALQLTTVDVTGVEDRPSRMEVNGEKVNPENYAIDPVQPGMDRRREHDRSRPRGMPKFPRFTEM